MVIRCHHDVWRLLLNAIERLIVTIECFDGRLIAAQGPGNEHYLAVGGKGSNVTRKDIRKFGETHNISARQADDILEQTLEATSRFAAIAKDTGVSVSTTKIVGKVLEMDRP